LIPSVAKAEFNAIPINWLGLHRQYLNTGEMELIAALLRAVEAKSMLEIGCRDGRTARVLLHNVSSIRHYVGVDVPMSYVPALAHQRAEMYPHPGALVVDDARFELIIREQGSLDLTAAELPPFDAVFIDGDHSERAVEYDSRMAYAVAQRLIIWHDYFNGAVGVTNALNRLAAEKWDIRHIEGTWLAYLIRRDNSAMKMLLE